MHDHTHDHEHPRHEPAAFVAHTHAATPPLLAVQDLVVGFRGVGLLPPLSFDLRAGELWALIGRNGSGKTTLLRTLLGLLPAVSGSVRRAPDLRLGYVPQRHELDASLPGRVIDIVRGGEDHGWSFLQPLRRWRLPAETERALRDADVLPWLQLPFSSLSEGQKQRVLLAKALVHQPQVLVLDEPTSAMDLLAERRTFELIDRLRHERQLAVLVVSHHLGVIASRATDVLVVDKDDGLTMAGCTEDVARDPRFIERFGSFDCRGLPPNVAPALSAAETP